MIGADYAAASVAISLEIRSNLSNGYATNRSDSAVLTIQNLERQSPDIRISTY
jgi:hypothetical protein